MKHQPELPKFKVENSSESDDCNFVVAIESIASNKVEQDASKSDDDVIGKCKRKTRSKGKRRSSIWKFFDTFESYNQCKVCRFKFSLKSEHSNLLRHISRRHPSLLSKVRKWPKPTAEKDDSLFSLPDTQYERCTSKSGSTSSPSVVLIRPQMCNLITENYPSPSTDMTQSKECVSKTEDNLPPSGMMTRSKAYASEIKGLSLSFGAKIVDSVSEAENSLSDSKSDGDRNDDWMLEIDITNAENVEKTKTSCVWKFVNVKDNFLECKICRHEFSSKTLSNVLRHLRKQHSSVYEKVSQILEKIKFEKSADGKINPSSSAVDSKSDMRNANCMLNIDAMGNKRRARIFYLRKFYKYDANKCPECQICKYKFSNKSGTSNLWRHMKRIHPTVLSKIKRRELRDRNGMVQNCFDGTSESEDNPSSSTANIQSKDYTSEREDNPLVSCDESKASESYNNKNNGTLVPQAMKHMKFHHSSGYKKIKSQKLRKRKVAAQNISVDFSEVNNDLLLSDNGSQSKDQLLSAVDNTSERDGGPLERCHIPQRVDDSPVRNNYPHGSNIISDGSLLSNDEPEWDDSGSEYQPKDSESDDDHMSDDEVMRIIDGAETKSYGKQKTSLVWKFFRIDEDNCPHCKICKRKFTNKIRRSNLEGHLQRIHPSSYATVKLKFANQKSSTCTQTKDDPSASNDQPKDVETDINFSDEEWKKLDAAEKKRKKPRQFVSFIWKFFDFNEDNCPECKICHYTFSSSDRSNLERHLKKFHRFAMERIKPHKKGLSSAGERLSTEQTQFADSEDNNIIENSAADFAKGKTGVKCTAVWDLFKIIDKNYAQCKICDDVFSCKWTVGNLRRHVQRKHETHPWVFNNSKIRMEISPMYDSEEEQPPPPKRVCENLPVSLSASTENTDEPVPAHLEPCGNTESAASERLLNAIEEGNQLLRSMHRAIENQGALLSRLVTCLEGMCQVPS